VAKPESSKKRELLLTDGLNHSFKDFAIKHLLVFYGFECRMLPGNRPPAEAKKLRETPND